MAPPLGHPKAGGRVKGTPNKTKSLIITERGKAPVEVILAEQTPKAVLLDCMAWFMRKARQAKGIAKATELRLHAMEAARYVSPYTHPRLSAVWLQGDRVERFVIRAPEVVLDAGEWERLAGPRLEAEAEDAAPDWAK